MPRRRAGSITMTALLSIIVGCAAEQPDDSATCTGGKCDSFSAGPDIGDERNETWVFVQSHLHTTGGHECADDPLETKTPCYQASGVKEALEAALEFGASDMIITDHNNIDAWFDPAFAPLATADMSRYATPLRGTEWSASDGHLTLVLPRKRFETNAAALEAGLIWRAGKKVDAGKNHSSMSSPAPMRSVAWH